MALHVDPVRQAPPEGHAESWGEAMSAAVYMFGVMFMAFGVVPHQWIDHADKELGWNKSSIIYGPFDLLKPKARGGPFPFTMSYEAIRDIVVVILHVWYFGLMIFSVEGVARPRRREAEAPKWPRALWSTLGEEELTDGQD